jgi:hypothetical protein
MSKTDFNIIAILFFLFFISLIMNKIPKSYTGKFWDFLKANYHKHLLLGGLIGMVINTTFSGVPVFLQLFLTIFVSGLLGGMWEAAWAAYNGTKPDIKDVFYTVLAALIAVVAHM